jgi:hypothetical protein
MIYAKAAALLAILAAFAWGAYADYHAGVKAGQDSIQRLWDADLLKRQAITDTAIAQATKERDAAIAANEGIANDYQIKLDSANANAADFARRMRDATSRLLAGSSTMPKAGSGQAPSDPSQASSAGQLQQLASLTAGLHAECLANNAQLEALIAEVKPWLGDGAPVR